MDDRSYSPKEIESVNEFLEELGLSGNNKTSKQSGETIFYRGQSNKEWTLCLGIYRDEFVKEDIEKDPLGKFSSAYYDEFSKERTAFESLVLKLFLSAKFLSFRNIAA